MNVIWHGGTQLESQRLGDRGRQISVQDWPALHSEFQDNQSYVERPLTKQNKKENTMSLVMLGLFLGVRPKGIFT